MKQDHSTGNETAGQVVRDHRETEGMSLDDLSRATGLSRSFLHRIERGRRGMNVQSLAKIVRAFPQYPFFVTRIIQSYDQIPDHSGACGPAPDADEYQDQA